MFYDDEEKFIFTDDSNKFIENIQLTSLTNSLIYSQRVFNPKVGFQNFEKVKWHLLSDLEYFRECLEQVNLEEDILNVKHIKDRLVEQ